MTSVTHNYHTELLCQPKQKSFINLKIERGSLNKYNLYDKSLLIFKNGTNHIQPGCIKNIKQGGKQEMQILFLATNGI